MHVTLGNVAAAVLWSLAGGLAAWLVLLPVRRRSLAGLLASLVITGAAASLGGMLGAIHSMLLPSVSWQTVAVITGLSVVITAVAAVGVGRRLARENLVLSRAVGELGEGRIPSSDGRTLTVEVERVRTELRVTAEALAAARDRERALESARRDLVSWVSHDLRTPLAGLRAMAEALEDGVAENPELYYKQIGLSVERLNRMVEDLFDLSRIQTGGATKGAEHVDLDDLVSDCLAALEPLATAHGVRLCGAVDAPALVTGNSMELNRALTNLVGNAIRHTRAQGLVDVRVGVRRTGDAVPQAEVLVRDECGGIPEPHLRQVFDVGFRGEAARTPHSATVGAGLGLAITRGIIEAHDGTVEVENTEGGCQFRLRLPVAAPTVTAPVRQALR